MPLKVHDENGALIVSLETRVDRRHSRTLRRRLGELLAQRRPVVVDMAKVEYIDSSGVACLVEALQTARDNATRFVLAAVSPPALKVLQLARLDEVFALADTVAAAVKE